MARAKVLSNFIFMVWKFQILTAPMDVKLLPQIFGTHHRTF